MVKKEKKTFFIYFSTATIVTNANSSLVFYVDKLHQIGNEDDTWFLNSEPKSLKLVADPFGTLPNNINPREII